MAGKLYRKHAIAAKIETTQGTDSVPTPAANAMLVTNFAWNPLEMTAEMRELARAYLGHSESIVVARWITAEFEVEIAGAGAAGTVPKYGPLLRGCGFSETITAGTNVVYAPVSDAFESVSIYCNIDKLLHKSKFAMGSVALSLDANKIPKFKFSYRGLFLPVTDTTDWAPVYTGFVKPLGVTPANSQLTLHGLAAVVDKLQLDMKNEVQYRSLYNFEGVQIGNRAPDGSISLEMTTVAALPWMTRVAAGTTGALQVVHGTVAGNIVQFDAPTVQLFSPRFGDSQGIQMLQANLGLMPGASGNDEITITVK